MRDEDDAPAQDAAEAFEALRAEVAGLRRAVDALGALPDDLALIFGHKPCQRMGKEDLAADYLRGCAPLFRHKFFQPGSI